MMPGSDFTLRRTTVDKSRSKLYFRFLDSLESDGVYIRRTSSPGNRTFSRGNRETGCRSDLATDFSSFFLKQAVFASVHWSCSRESFSGSYANHQPRKFRLFPLALNVFPFFEVTDLIVEDVSRVLQRRIILHDQRNMVEYEQIRRWSE